MKEWRFVKVKVEAASDADVVKQINDDEFFVKTRALRERGKANDRVREILSLYLRMPPSKIVLVKGHKSSSKIFKIYKQG